MRVRFIIDIELQKYNLFSKRCYYEWKKRIIQIPQILLNLMIQPFFSLLIVSIQNEQYKSVLNPVTSGISQLVIIPAIVNTLNNGSPLIL
mgnify:CR=1 FL=1